MSLERTLLHGSRPVAMVVVGISSAITSARLALHPGAPSCRRHVEFCSLAPTRTQELLTECSSGRAAPSEMVLQAVRSLPFSASPSRSLGSLNRVSGSPFLREAPGIVRSCELVVKRISLQQCQQVRKSEGRISLAQSYSSSAQSSLSEEACEDIIDPGLLARVAKLYRPVVILPGLGNNSSDYDVLVRSIEAVEVACTVVKVARVDWLRNVAGLLYKDYWTGKLRPRPVLDWYLEKVKTAIHTAKAGSADQKVSLIGHSAGGWLARVYMAEFGTEDISLLLTLGTPHLPPPRGVPGVFDQTRGLLNYVEENCPGAYHAPNVKYVCVAGRYVKGAGRPLETASTAPVVTGAGTFDLDEVSSLDNKIEENLVNAVSDNDSLKAEKLVNELVLEEARPEAVTASRPTFRDRLIGAGYKQVCGRADVWGDGVVPEESAYLEGAINISLDGVYHSPVGADDSERPWYGSSGKIDQWVQYLLE